LSPDWSHPEKGQRQRTQTQEESKTQTEFQGATELGVLEVVPRSAPARQLLRPPHSTNPRHPTHWEPSRVMPESHLPDPQGQQSDRGRSAPGGRRPIVARLRRADGRAYGRPGRPKVWVAAQRFRVGRCSWASPWTTRVQRNVRARDRSQRTASLAGGGRSYLRAFAAGGLPGDCTWGAAGGAAVQSAPCSARRVGALDRGADRCAGAPGVGEAACVCRRGGARQPAGVARRADEVGSD